ncbi:L-type lectin-domain containing protein [Listeria valentina]|uniref:L-type lectin-domain containing protein n=1 Tax=Listeria valentina TaxID=2705293 RepID=UPI0014304DEB|nr:L-type lectin-domain containing protein [Listeria valentina]
MKKLVFSFLAITTLFVALPNVSYASEANNPPTGIKTEGIFQVPAGANSSVISGDKLDIVEVTNDTKKQAGAIWNTDNNMMDLTKDFSSSMYMYFGDKGSKAADGMAFVMQADPNKNNAFRTGEGERLGVWDSNKRGEFGLAIMNSVAIEFDTHYNEDFDKDISKKRNHVAWNFPGKRSSYYDHSSVLGSSYRKLIHNDLQYPTDTYLSDDKWHHFQINWDASASTLTYQLDSLSPVVIPINVSDVFGTSSVYWGFTGSTGDSYAQNRIVFENVPGLVNGSVHEEAFTKDSHESIVGKKAYAGDTITHEITTTYEDGKVNWDHPVLTKDLDANLSYVPGTLKMVDQAGKETALSDDLWDGNSLQVPLDDLDKANKFEKIIFDVKAKQVAADYEVKHTDVVTGSNFIAHSDEMTYTLSSNAPPSLTLQDAGSTISLKDNEELVLNGSWLDRDSDSVSLYYQVDESEPIKFAGDLANVPAGNSHDFSTKLKLATGTHTVKVYAVDSAGATSNVEKISVSVDGTLTFLEIPAFSFGNLAVPTSNTTLFPVSPGTLKFSDTRVAGSAWKLSAKLKQEMTSTDGNHTIPNGLVFIGSDGTKQVLSKNESILIDSGTSNEETEKNIEWDNQQGLALNLNPGLYKGNYAGEVEWTLEDTPNQ